jgi:hypothetical protein
MDLTFKRGDQLPFFTATLTDEDGIRNLSNSTVSFKYRLKNGGAVTSGDATVNDATNGKVQYEWTTGDVSGAGIFYGEFEEYVSGSRVLTWPRDRHLLFEIIDDLR